MPSVLELLRELPVLVALLERSPLVLMTLVSLAAFVVIGFTVFVVGRKK